MDKFSIIAELAKEGRVETIVSAIVKDHRPEIQDLCQIVYLALLDSSEETITTAYRDGWLGYKIVRIIENQYKRKQSTFRHDFTRYTARTDELTHDIADG